MVMDLTGAERVIDYTARVESGGRYDAWNPNDMGQGVSYGLIQFNQRVGGLPDLFQTMRTMNPARFSAIFGDHAGNFADRNWVRGANLNVLPYASYAGGKLTGGVMLAASQEPDFQAAQRALAKSGYFDPAVAVALEVGWKSERAHAMLFDTAVQRGSGNMRKFAQQAATAFSNEADALVKFAALADAGKDSNGNYVFLKRRTKILTDPNVSDRPFDLMNAGEGAPLAAAMVFAGLVLWWWGRRR